MTVLVVVNYNCGHDESEPTFSQISHWALKERVISIWSQSNNRHISYRGREVLWVKSNGGKSDREREGKRDREVIESLHFNQVMRSGILTHQVCGECGRISLLQCWQSFVCSATEWLSIQDCITGGLEIEEAKNKTCKNMRCGCMYSMATGQASKYWVFRKQ